MSVETMTPETNNGHVGKAAAPAPHALGAGESDEEAPAAAAHNGVDGAKNGGGQNAAAEEEELAEDVKPEVDIKISNTMCTFNVRCHLNIRDIAQRGANVKYRKAKRVRSFEHKLTSYASFCAILLPHPWRLSTIRHNGNIGCQSLIHIVCFRMS